MSAVRVIGRGYTCSHVFVIAEMVVVLGIGTVDSQQNT